MNRVERFARDYAEAAWSPGYLTVAYKSYMSGYSQCVEDEVNVNMDEWQQRLSDDYSDMKVKYHTKCMMLSALKKEAQALRKEIEELKNPTHDQKLENLIKLREEFEQKVFY